MLSTKIERALNAQVTVEAESSQVYLAMASWAEVQGFEGVATFMYAHSDEEREHMLKLIKFINEGEDMQKFLFYLLHLLSLVLLKICLRNSLSTK